MNIWDIGSKSGISRANIDFYEKKGLLSPTFDELGCRAYSDADLETLMRIKLLRQLGISIDIISLIHAYEIELSDVLEEQLSKPASDITELEAKIAICRAIKEYGISYSELDAQKYLERFDEISNCAYASRLIEEETVPQLRHPWRRYFARSLDFGVYSLFLYFILYVVIGTYPIKNGFVQLLITFVVFALMIFIEPLLLSNFGTTLGKWIFGLSLTDINGHKPNYSMGLTRTWGIFAKGYGYNIPIYDLVRNYKCYKACKNGEALPWDEGFVYSIHDTKAYRAYVYIAVIVILAAANIILEQNAEMPKNRGEISAEEFAENYNDFMDYISANSYSLLKADGTIEKDPYTIEIYECLPNKYKIIEENGIVSGVSFEVESKDILITSSNAEMIACVMSYVAAQPKMNIFKLRSEGILNNFKYLNFQSFEFTSAGVYVSCKVEYRGYTQYENCLSSNEGEDRYYHLIFEMKKID